MHSTTVLSTVAVHYPTVLYSALNNCQHLNRAANITFSVITLEPRGFEPSTPVLGGEGSNHSAVRLGRLYRTGQDSVVLTPLPCNKVTSPIMQSPPPPCGPRDWLLCTELFTSQYNCSWQQLNYNSLRVCKCLVSLEAGSFLANQLKIV